MKTTISGSSDDLVIIGGRINDEYGCYGHKKLINISASDGTRATIFYDGEWKIKVSFAGDNYLKLVEARPDLDIHEDEDAKESPTYSDVLVFEDGIEWVKVAGKKYH